MAKKPQAKTETAPPVASDAQGGQTILAQMGPGDMLGPQKDDVRALPLNGILQLGTVLLEARGLSYRHNKQDETKPSVAIIGPAKFIPFSENRPELVAMRTYLPGAVHDTIVAALQGDVKAPIDRSPGRKERAIDVALPPGATVPVVLEIAVQSKPETAVGYIYMTKSSPKVPLKLNDPLAALTAVAGLKALPKPK